MAQLPESKQMARAIRRHGIGLVGQHGQRMMKAQVLRTDPLAVELLTSDVQIEAEHLLLGSWVRYYDSRYGIATGDTVLLTRMDDGDWFVTDVVSQEQFDLGDAPDEAVVVDLDTGSGHIIRKIPYYDENGAEIGVLLLYDPPSVRAFVGHTTAAGAGASVVPS